MKSHLDLSQSLTGGVKERLHHASRLLHLGEIKGQDICADHPGRVCVGGGRGRPSR